MFTLALIFLSNVDTIPQKKSEFLTKASLFIAGLQHFDYLMHLPTEFLIFYYMFLSSITFTQNISSVLECQSF